ncbi:hypothetical protein EQ500_01950 [Lactobacillus sp. XV13L]|nr:hypothetical protein [Lactobacillus sp. XV13L]
MNRRNFDPNLVQQFLNEYHDRGMLKWQGFYLSDHTAKLNQCEKQSAAKLQHKHLVSSQMSEPKIEEISCN